MVSEQGCKFYGRRAGYTSAYDAKKLNLFIEKLRVYSKSKII